MALAILGFGRTARAQLACQPSNIVIEGSGVGEGAAAPQELAQVLATELGEDFSVLYVQQPSCFALQDFVQNQGGSAPEYAYQLNAIAAMTTACIVDNTLVPDFVISEMSGETCAANVGKPTAAMWSANAMARRELLGPVNVTSFVVPSGSHETSISADAAYVVFGFGGAQFTVPPWTSPASLFPPGLETGTLNLVSNAIGLPAAKWAAVSKLADSLDSIVPAVSKPANAAATLGILPNASAETLPDSIHVLAYQQTGQACGYLPNSDSLHRNLINVRQGRYALWSPLYVYMKVDVTGAVVDHASEPNAALTAIADFLAASGPTPPGPGDAGTAQDDAAGIDATFDSGEAGAVVPPFDPSVYLTTMAEEGLIPWCAMQVARSSDFGTEMSYQPAVPCGCAFESIRGATLSACPTCRADSDCNTAVPRCRFGYCEVQ